MMEWSRLVKKPKRTNLLVLTAPGAAGRISSLHQKIVQPGADM
jgi:hypothetical protein